MIRRDDEKDSAFHGCLSSAAVFVTGGADIDCGDDDNEEDHQHGNVAPVANFVSLEGQLPRPVLGDIGAVGRAALRERSEEIELLQREDQAERDDGAELRAHHRQGD